MSADPRAVSLGDGWAACLGHLRRRCHDRLGHAGTLPARADRLSGSDLNTCRLHLSYCAGWRAAKSVLARSQRGRCLSTWPAESVGMPGWLPGPNRNSTFSESL